MAVVALSICTPCAKANCEYCLYEVSDLVTREVVICQCDDADHIRCIVCRRPLLRPGCDHHDVCGDCKPEFNCDQCVKEDQQ